MINVYNGHQNHPGNQPIRVLFNYISYSFQNVNPSIVSDHDRLKAQGLIKDNINYIINELPIYSDEGVQLPYIENGVISIHEVFLMYLWCICYSIHIPFYVTVHKKQIYEDNLVLKTNCDKLLQYGMSLKTKYSVLNKNCLLNPEIYFELDKEYIEITNSIYLMALNFILCHEYSHAKYQLFNRTKLDEEKADFEAAKMIFNGSKDENELGNRAIGGIAGLSSLLLLSPIMNSDNHPDTDKRLYNFIKQIPIEDEWNEIWAFGYIAFAYWDHIYKVGLDFNSFNLFMSYKNKFIHLIEQ